MKSSLSQSFPLDSFFVSRIVKFILVFVAFDPVEILVN